MSSYTIRQGDTLSALARKFGTSVDALVRANGIQNPDLIYTGAKLIIPGKQDDFGKKPIGIEEGTGSFPKFDPRKIPNDEEPTGATQDPRRADSDDDEVSQVANTQFQDNAHKSFPTQDGYPLYRQGDPEWASRNLGSKGKIGPQGCALSSVAMALSGISGQTVNPGKMDEHMDRIGGYQGAMIARWDQMGKAISPPVGVNRTDGLTASKIDAQLAGGKPVVVAVDYKVGGPGNRRAGHDGRNDHWVLITGKNADGSYRCNDPATGKTFKMHKMADGRLQAEEAAKNGSRYVTTGSGVTFSRGAPKGAGQTSNDAQSIEQTTPRPNAKSMDLQQQLSSPDSALSVAIGHAEGNRTVTGGKTSSYGGHVDPGNSAHNLGTFSYQTKQNASVTTAAQADAVQLGRLRGQIPKYETACRKAGVDSSDPRLQAAYFDLWNQSPRMAQRFLDRMGATLGGGKPLTVENLTKARLNSCYDDAGKFTSTGLKNPDKAFRDQLRRQRALEAVLQQRGIV